MFNYLMLNFLFKFSTVVFVIDVNNLIISKQSLYIEVNSLSLK